MANDEAPPIVHFEVKHFPGIEYILAVDNGNPQALFLLCTTDTQDSAEVHFSMMPSVWGDRAVDIARAFVAQVWRDTQLKRLFGLVPSYNRLALRLALKAGFERRAIHCAAGTRRGISYDLIQVEAVRPV